MSNRYARGHKPRPPDEEVVRLYREHRDSEIVGQICGCSGTTVLHIVHRTGHGDLVPPKGGRPGQRKIATALRLTNAEIVERYQAGASLGLLIEQTGASYKRLREILEAAGVKVRTSTEQMKLMGMKR